VKSAAHASLKGLKVGDRVVTDTKENKDNKLEAVSVTFGKSSTHADTGTTDTHH